VGKSSMKEPIAARVSEIMSTVFSFEPEGKYTLINKTYKQTIIENFSAHM